MNQRLPLLLAVACVLGPLCLALGVDSVARAQNSVAELISDRGAYLAQIAGCAACHSPAGGPLFSGNIVEWHGSSIHAPNLTPSASGLGNWTDEAIRAAITQGIVPNGRQLHPVMPYLYYNGMADTDVDALINYLRSLEPVETPAESANDLSRVTLPPTPPPRSGIVSPHPADEIAYGEYLVEAVMACGSCHTPTLDNGEPDPALHLAGGTAFSGEWGTVYASNLTPQTTSGLGRLSDEAVILAIVAGRHPDRRPIYAMPWQAYSILSGQDVQAIVTYLRSVDPILNDVPPAQLNAGYERYATSDSSPSVAGVALTVIMAVLMGGLLAYLIVRQYRYMQRIRETDWEEHFRAVVSEIRTSKGQSGLQTRDRHRSNGPGR